jgi:hypothetical protein
MAIQRKKAHRHHLANRARQDEVTVESHDIAEATMPRYSM